MNVRFRHGLVLLPLLLWMADARSLLAASPRLLAPGAGAELIGGSFAAIEWESAPVRAEEWEAFLSFDGGRTYPLRITPHLDVSIRRFGFRVPPVPTRQARVMLRFGDERRETEVETPQRFAILPDGGTWWPPPALALVRGERPRRRDGGVVAWIEGARDGSGLREVVTVAVPSSLHAVEPARLPWIPLLWPARDRTDLAAPRAGSQEGGTPARGLDLGPFGSPPQRLPVRLLTHRFNE